MPSNELSILFCTPADDDSVFYRINLFVPDRSARAELIGDIQWTLWEAGTPHVRVRPSPASSAPPPLPSNVVVYAVKTKPPSDVCQHHRTLKEIEAAGALRSYKRVVMLNDGVRVPLLNRRWVQGERPGSFELSTPAHPHSRSHLRSRKLQVGVHPRRAALD